MNKRPYILIVDDDPSARETTELLLMPEGYQMSFAVSGPDALAQLAELEPDVILLDVMMPGMDGYEVCRRLKAAAAWRHIPVILVTALDTKENLALGLDAGADDFVSKPVNKLELRARVRSMLRIKQRHDDLEQLMRLREDLSNMVMHDMRSPLTAMALYLDLLEKESLSPQGQNSLKTLRIQANRLNSFITDMLVMTKLEQGKLVLYETDIEMRELLTVVYENYQLLADSRGLKFVLELPNAPLYLTGDANLWQRVLDNLISNALKFSLPGGAVTLRLKTAPSEREQRFCLQVLDEGPGVPPEHRETVFDKFQIVSVRRRDITQMGLGLAFCKLVVEAHRGRIYITDNEPQGAIFNIEL